MLQNPPYRLKQFLILLKSGKIGIVLYDLLCASKEKACLARPYHAEIVMAVSAGDSIKPD